MVAGILYSISTEDKKMANRSYLYSIDFDSTIIERSDDHEVCGLSEWAYEIPLAYKILVSQDAKTSQSIIFGYDKPIAIIGDFQKGREKLFLFLAELIKMDILDKEKLKEQIHYAETYLRDIKHENKYIILECGEIFAMDYEELEEPTRNLYENEILKIDETINAFVHDITAEKTTEEEKFNKLGINFWDEDLYYG
jgi:hypothetical protein